MNLLLLTDEDFLTANRVRLTGRRSQHASEVLRAAAGDILRVGKINGLTGTARVETQTPDALELEVTLHAPPPPRPGVDVLLAIPRPKALKKVLPALASMGVDKIVLVNAARVEKSYFDSDVLSPEKTRELLCLGLEQARDTVLPEVFLRTRFRPFVEDELSSLFASDEVRLMPHPGVKTPLADVAQSKRKVVAIGPEGGWIPFEVDLLQSQGFAPVTLGPRILRVETVVPYVIGALSTRSAAPAK